MFIVIHYKQYKLEQMFWKNMNQMVQQQMEQWLGTQINPICHAFTNGGERDETVLHPCHSQSDGMFQEKPAQYLDFLQV
jgi:hypothetical protein